MSRFRLVLLLSAVLVLGLAAPAWATHDTSNFKRMDLLFADPNETGAVNSDLAFWGDRAYAGNYDGIRIFDISDPEEPELTADFRCFGPQNDVSVWDTNGDDREDLLITSVDRTLSGPECGATAVAHDDPNGWEGLRLFRISGNVITQIGSVYQDCGSHTHTGYLWGNGLRVLNSSYPLRPGPTCGPVRGPEAGRDPAHGVVQVVQVPFANPANAAEIAELPISYPNDPAKPCPTEMDPNAMCAANAFYAFSERGLAGDPHDPASGLVEPMRACHDISVLVPKGLVGAACAENLQLWSMKSNGLPDTENPLWVYDQHNVDFWHSVTFSWDGAVVNAIDESFGAGCPTTTQLPAGNGGQLVESGNMFFFRTRNGAKLSELRAPRPEAFEHYTNPDGTAGAPYCSAHLGVPVPSADRYLLVNAWYTGGVDVVDFTFPFAPHEVAYWDVDGDNWSAYWYETGKPKRKSGFEVYASSGVHMLPTNPGEGFQAFRANLEVRRRGVDHLNPQTQEFVLKGPSKAARKAAARRAKLAKKKGATKRAARSSGAPSRATARHLAP